MTRTHTCIDLFAGCGGISYGFEQAGFQTIVAIDNDLKAIEVLRANMPSIEYVLCEDLNEFTPKNLESTAGIKSADVIVGGPPCQGYSTVRQFDGANNGHRLVEDSRRVLYKKFLEYVDYFKPKVFVMENVLGMRSAENGRHFKGLAEETERIGYKFISLVVNASDYGVPQNRRRLLSLGFSKVLDNASMNVVQQELFNSKSSSMISLWEAIGDLPPLEAGEGDDPTCYNMKLRRDHQNEFPNSKYLDWSLDNTDIHKLTAHVARPHNQRDLRDFERLRPGENSKNAIDRGVEMEFPYNRDVFQDKYSRLAKDRPSRSILAHISKDGLMYIHPTQIRSLTPREAARLQSFPDSFQFPVPRTHQFRLIGNAVPPLLSKRVAQAIIKVI